MSEVPKSGNPFDQTLHDPIDPTQSIPDQMHGQEVALGLSLIPPMPKVDGTYHVFGGFYRTGTNTFDAAGKPFIEVTSYMVNPAQKQEMQALADWVAAYSSGELPNQENGNLPDFDYEAAPYLVCDAGESTLSAETTVVLERAVPTTRRVDGDTVTFDGLSNITPAGQNAYRGIEPRDGDGN